MANGRVESYVHSDSVTRHKGGVLVRITCDTDFAAKTAGFIGFCETVARYVYAAQTESWETAVNIYPDLEILRSKISKELKEKITVTDIRILIL